ncbi:hypothetical protein PF008_g25672 [Phytophthora fragariae]|uniref:Uncharacterized protein n=1 Tax=Phytophthora fragariae TaxID=53985 RepID=A0A6G0QJ97_9STRA|nr:hypothetical protein PF008_g25672 [Phytophthora fragariae]
MGPLELRVVAFVLQHQPYIATPKELGTVITSFLCPSSNLSLSDACKLDSLPLLDWIWASSCASVAQRGIGWSLTHFLRSDMHYYRWQFSKALTVVAERGDLGMLRWLFEHFGGCVVPVEAVEAAAANGHLAVLKYLREVDTGRERDQDRVAADSEIETEWNGPGNWVCWGGRSMLKAVENGHADVARWLYSNCPYALTDNELELVICGALKRGDIEFAQWLVPPTRSLFDYASDCPRPDVIEMMLENGNLQRDQNATVVAIRDLATHGQLDLMKRIAQIYTTPPTNDGVWLDYWRRAMAEAIKREDLVMLQWLPQTVALRSCNFFTKKPLLMTMTTR